MAAPTAGDSARAPLAEGASEHKAGAGAASGPRAAATNFGDEALYEYFACYVADPDLRFAMRAELERRIMETKPKKGAQPAVKLATLQVLPGGFVLQWRRKANTRAGYAWWKRVADGVVGFDDSSVYHVVGCTELPSAKRGAASGAEHASAKAAPSAAKAGVFKRITHKRKLRTAEARPAAGPSAASAARPASQPGPRCSVDWPRFKVRRLLGGLTGENGVGARARDYKLGERLGQGSYGSVFKSSLGGVSLAVKVVSKDKQVAALLEASLAEVVAGHPNLVDLKDAVLRADGASMLVYLHGGRSLEHFEKGRGPGVPAPRCMLDCLAGLSYLHSLWLYHSDIKPANILVQEEAGCFARARVADLGGLVEVCPGNMCLNEVLTTQPFKSPELLLQQKEALGALWLRADVWALGITLCRVVGFSPTYGRRPAEMRHVLRGMFYKRKATWPRALHNVLGGAGIDFLDMVLQWSAEARPDSKAVLGHGFLQERAMRGHGFAASPPSFPGERHEWTVLQGIMSTDVLKWIQEDASRLEEWKRAKGVAHSLGPMPKWRLGGKMVEKPATSSCNKMPLNAWLPAPRLLAWLRAFKAANEAVLARLQARALEATWQLGEQHRVGNAAHFLKSSLPSWFLAAGELHIFEGAAGGVEDRHSDGGASCLHMGVTLYGRREASFFLPEASVEGGFAPASRQRATEIKLSFVPGSVYLGTVTGAPHQVSHLFPRDSCEELRGHGLTCMIRTALFPLFRSRVMNTTPSPPELFHALVRSFNESLISQAWVLPSLDQCLAAAEA